MALYMAVQTRVSDSAIQGAERASRRSGELAQRFGVTYQRYRYDPANRTLFCLIDAPSKDVAAEALHETLGLNLDDLVEILDWLR
jgi:uncharacterized protein DUF4242